MIDMQYKKRHYDTKKERKEATLQELQKSFVCNIMDEVLCTNYIMQSKFRIEGMVAVTVFVPAQFKS